MSSTKLSLGPVPPPSDNSPKTDLPESPLLQRSFLQRVSAMFSRASLRRSQVPDLVSRCSKGEQLASSDIILYLQILQKKYQNVQFSSVALTSQVNIETIPFPKIAEDTHLVVIPVILKSSLLFNHIVLLCYDNYNNTIEFFDSEGQSLEKRKKQKLLSEHSFQAFLDAFIAFYRAPDKPINILESRMCYQKRTDWKNCGVFILAYLKNRIEDGVSAEEMLLDGRNPILPEGIKKIRAQLLQEISNDQISVEAAEEDFEVVSLKPEDPNALVPNPFRGIEVTNGRSASSSVDTLPKGDARKSSENFPPLQTTPPEDDDFEVV